MHAETPTFSQRVLAEWRLKLLLTVLINVAIDVPYLLIQRYPLFPVRTLGLTVFDRWVAFRPRWVWVYNSLYLLMPLTPVLATTRAELFRYTRGLLALSFIGFVFFIILPVAFPRPAGGPADGMYGLLVWYDRPLNSFPSLHAGYALYTLLFGLALFRGRMRPGVKLFIAFVAAWAAATLYSTLPTKQHYAVDLPAGALLGWACHAWAWREARPRSVPATVVPDVTPSH